MLAGIIKKRSPIANKRKKTFLEKFVSKFSTGNKFWREGEKGEKKFVERDIKNIVTTAQESETLCLKL